MTSASEIRGQRISSQGSLDVFVGENANIFQAAADHVLHGLEQMPGGSGLAVPEDFVQMLELPADADDEAMVELAIALSLQNQNPPVPHEALMGAAAAGVPRGQQDHFSDNTSAASDDEGSTAATDGSTLRTSPVVNEAEPPLEPGSEGSGESPVESITGEQNISGRSSAYGEGETREGTSRIQSRGLPESIPDSSEFDPFDRNTGKLHTIRLNLLERLVESLPDVRDVGGIRCIPVMQVLLMLSSDLESDGERDRQMLSLLLNRLLAELYTCDANQMATRTPNHEVKLIIMRLLSILMSRVKTSSYPSTSSSKSGHADSGSVISSVITTQILLSSNILDLCLKMLNTLLEYWKSSQSEVERSGSSLPISTSSAPILSTGLLKAHSFLAPPDMSPFFLRQYVKGHADDVFELYPQLLSEMVLRLPYQVKKISNSLSSGGKGLVFSSLWMDTLCEYMMSPLTPYVKKQVRKLLSYICGSKEVYRQIRDFHALESHLKEIKATCGKGGFVEIPASKSTCNTIISLSYDATIYLIEHLKACNETAANRTVNWQKYCLEEKGILSFFMQISFLLDEGVSPIVLQLLLSALSPAKTSSKPSEGGIKVPVTIIQGGPSESSPSTESPSSHGSLHVRLSYDLIRKIDAANLSQFIKCFLLESNSTSLRWMSHSLIYHLYKNFEGSPADQSFLLDTLWSLWPKVQCYGRKSVQFVDLLGFFCLKINQGEQKEKEYAEKALVVLRQQNQLLMDHPNSNIYNSLQTLVEFDGYYLESEPCLVCNNPEVNYSNVKLSSLKVDSRFTTSTQIVKLVGSHTISKISLRISDIKRSKMVRTLSIYYNNRAVHSVVELKNKTGIWNRAKKCSLSACQTEVKIEFPLPIIACNLMIEYSDFYENIQASSETLQCPRCSASVAANPGEL